MKESIKVSTDILDKVRERCKETKQIVGGFYDLAAESYLAKDRPAVSEKQLIDAIDGYLGELADNPKISETKFHNMQVALYGAKCLVWDLFGSPRKRQTAMSPVSTKK
jgi:hypothetical protein